MSLASAAGAPAVRAVRVLRTDSDAACIARSLHDGAAFAALFDRHADEIRRYLARRLGAEVADDLAAETFTVAFRSRRRYDAAHADARPWLYGIATNLMRRHRRSEERRLRALRRESAGPGEELVADRAVARVSADAQRARLLEALATLGAHERDVLLLYAWAELGYEEIATALGVPVGTVRSRLARCRARLQPLLDGDDG